MIQLVLLNYKRKRKGDVIVSDENKNNAESSNPGEVNYVYQNRRYVGRKETVGFVLWDAAQSFNERFTDRSRTPGNRTDYQRNMGRRQ